MLFRKKTHTIKPISIRPLKRPIKIGIGVIILIAIWLGFEFTGPLLLTTPFGRFLALCCIGLGFIVLCYLLKT